MLIAEHIFFYYLAVLGIENPKLVGIYDLGAFQGLQVRYWNALTSKL